MAEALGAVGRLEIEPAKRRGYWSSAIPGVIRPQTGADGGRRVHLKYTEDAEKYRKMIRQDLGGIQAGYSGLAFFLSLSTNAKFIQKLRPVL